MQQACIPQFWSALATAPASGAELETCLHESLQVGPQDHSAPSWSFMRRLCVHDNIGLHNSVTEICLNTSAAPFDSFCMKAEGNLASLCLPQFWSSIRWSLPFDQGVYVEQGLSRVLQQHEQLLCLLRAQLLHKGPGPGSAAQCHSSSVMGMCMRYQQAVSAMVQDAAPVQLTGDPFFTADILSQWLSCCRSVLSAGLSCVA